MTPAPARAAAVRLLRPEASRHAELLAMMDEFGTDHIAGGAMGSQTVEELRDPGAFRAWVDLLERHEQGIGVP